MAPAVAHDSEDVGEALLYLAEYDYTDGQFWTAKRHLTQAFNKPMTAALHTRAMGLKSRVNRVIYGLYTGIFGITALLVIVFMFRIRQRRAGLTVDEFLAAYPDAYSEIAEICASIQHEVVKHNTTL